jgi:hypothetical protein
MKNKFKNKKSTYQEHHLASVNGSLGTPPRAAK